MEIRVIDMFHQFLIKTVLQFRIHIFIYIEETNLFANTILINHNDQIMVYK